MKKGYCSVFSRGIAEALDATISYAKERGMPEDLYSTLLKAASVFERVVMESREYQEFSRLDKELQLADLELAGKQQLYVGDENRLSSAVTEWHSKVNKILLEGHLVGTLMRSELPRELIEQAMTQAGIPKESIDELDKWINENGVPDILEEQ